MIRRRGRGIAAVSSGGSVGEVIAIVAATEVATSAMKRVAAHAKPAWIQTTLDAGFRVQNWSHPRRRLGQWTERVEIVAMLVYGVMLALQERDYGRRVAPTPGSEPSARRGGRLRRLRLPWEGRAAEALPSRLKVAAITTSAGVRRPGRPAFLARRHRPGNPTVA